MKYNLLVIKFSVFVEATYYEKIHKFIRFSQKRTIGFLSKF